MTIQENSNSRPLNRRFVLVSLLLSVFLSAMEGTAVSTAMPTIIGELGGVTLYAWVFAAYMFASSATIPLFGKLGDQYGRKPVFTFGIVLFIIGSILCGIAQSVPQLIFYRAIQGLGAGAVQPMALTIVGDLFTVRERVKVQAMFGTVWGIAGLSGPLLGSMLVELANWRWVFLINIPFGIFSLVLFSRFYFEYPDRREHVIDVLGFLALVVTSLSLMLASHGYAEVYLFALAFLSFVGFLWLEKHAKEPLIPLDLFRRRLMVVASSVGVFLGSQLFLVASFLPLYCESVLNVSAWQAGGVITTLVLGWPVAGFFSGRLFTRFGFRPFIILGGITVAISCLIISVLVSQRSIIEWFYGATLLLGCGFGLMNTALILAVQTSVSWQRRGVATASTMFFRTMGGTITVAVMGSILSQSLLSNPDVTVELANAVLKHGAGGKISIEQLNLVRDTLWQGLARIFFLGFCGSLVGAILCFTFPKSPLPNS